MKRESTNSTTPTWTYILDVKVVNGTVVDQVSGMTFQNLQRYNSTELMTNVFGSSRNKSIPIYVSEVSAFKPMYINQTIKWSKNTPNPPTNGVSPEFFNDGIRYRSRFYCYNKSDAHEPFSMFSHNNTDYRGYCLIWMNDKWNWVQCKNTYNPAAGTKFPFIFDDSESNLMTIQFDFNATQNRFKVFNDNGTQVMDSGTDISIQTGWVLPFMIGNWNGGQCDPYCVISDMSYILGSSCDDFLQ